MLATHQVAVVLCVHLVALISVGGGDECMLSVVMAARNDAWQAGAELGNSSTRLAVSVTAFIQHAERLGLSTQVVVVDYNPPTFQPSLRRQFFALTRWPKPWRYAELVFVTVPPEVHAQVRQQPTWRGYSADLFEYVAKNAGLRATRCRSVLVTNPDIVPSQKLMEHLANALQAFDVDRHKRQSSDRFGLKHGAAVTISRTNSRNPVPPALLQLDDAEAIERLLRADAQPPVWAPGDFLLAARSTFFNVGGFPEIGSNAGCDDVMAKLLEVECTSRHGAGLVRLTEPHAVLHQPHLGEVGRASREASELRAGKNGHFTAAAMVRTMHVISSGLTLNHCLGPRQWGLAYWMSPGEGASNGSTTVWGEQCGPSGRCSEKPALSLQRGGSCVEAVEKRMLSESEDTCKVAHLVHLGETDRAMEMLEAMVPRVLTSGGNGDGSRGDSIVKRKQRDLARLVAVYGVLQHLGMFVEEGARWLTLAARLQPLEWRLVARTSNCFRQAWGTPSVALAKNKGDIRSSYARIADSLVSACAHGAPQSVDLSLSLYRLCPTFSDINSGT